ncbi:uncharacterized protein CBL_00242 [Carabus blaptoides fortunei]
MFTISIIIPRLTFRTMDKLLEVYKVLSQTQSIVGAKLLRGCVVNSIWSQRNIESGKNVKYLRAHVLDSQLNKLVETVPVDVSNELLTAVSISEKYRAVLREVPNEKEANKQFLEVWSKNKLTHSVDLGALNLHGNVYTDVEFKSFSWSPDETKIIYIAEKKLPPRIPFCKRTDANDADYQFNKEIVSAKKGEEYFFNQDWGEQLVGKSSSVIAMYDLDTDSVKILKGIPESRSLCPGQVTWSPDGTYIAGVALKTEPRKLGLIYCTNRSGVIFKLDLLGSYEPLSETNRSVSAPRFSPDGKYLIWLEKDVGGPHNAAMTLMRLELPFSNCKSATVVVDIVQTEITTTNNQPFYGMFNEKLPERCWISDNRIIISTPQKYAIKSYVINIETGEVTELITGGNDSNVVLDVHNDTVLVCRKNYLHPDQLVAALVPEKGKENNIEWKELTECENIDLLENMTYEYLDLEQDTQDEVKKFNAIYFGPKTGLENKTTLIVWPHGGPHSAFSNSFALEPSVLVSMGFGIVFVNYRGSIGAGEVSLKFLLGRVGDTDVKDCVLAAKHCTKKYPWLKPDHMCLVGGSHGGFLVHHLSGQYPDMFKAVVSRNPVVDIASMSVISDIPDWCAVEVGSEYTQQGEVNNELLLTMRKASPIQYAHKIKAATYFMLGSKDLRVPCSQGLELYYRLIANGVYAKCNMYEDNHTLSAVPNEMDHIINSTAWLLGHTIF